MFLVIGAKGRNRNVSRVWEKEKITLRYNKQRQPEKRDDTGNVDIYRNKHTDTSEH